jgi:hypothetical protein
MDPNSGLVPAREGALLDVSSIAQDANKRRLRDRYLATRFPQFQEPGAALRNAGDVARWARQLLDDDQPRLAEELLQLALEEDPGQRALWLFRIELAFLNSDEGTFNTLADEFKRRFGDDPACSEAIGTIDAMGVELDPADPRYANAGPPQLLPNWSTPDMGERDEVKQRKLHGALLEAVAFHSALVKG